MILSKNEAYNMIFKEYPDIVNVEQMSKMLGISEKSAYRLLQKGAIKYLKVGRIYKIPKIYILDYLKICENIGVEKFEDILDG